MTNKPPIFLETPINKQDLWGAADAEDIENHIHIWLLDEQVQNKTTQELIRQLQAIQYSFSLFKGPAEINSSLSRIKPKLLLIKLTQSLTRKSAAELQVISSVIQGYDCPVFIITPDDDFQSRLCATRLGIKDYGLDTSSSSLLGKQISEIIEHRFAVETRVLLMADDPGIAKKYLPPLKNAGMTVTTLNNPAAIADTLLAFKPELVLIAPQVASYSAADIVGVIRQYSRWNQLPIVYLAPRSTVAQQEHSVFTGSDGILIESISNERLISAIYDHIYLARRLNSAINKDSLTGLLNQSSIKEVANTTLMSMRRTQGTTTYVMLDIDNFKEINDTYGHSSGDAVLTALARLLKNRLRRTDAIGRYGGDEFLIILSNCDDDSACKIFNDIRQLFFNLPFYHLGEKFTCTISIGLTRSSEHHLFDSAELIDIADNALYTAKQSGRNQIAQLASTDIPTSIAPPIPLLG
jgi:diguanylate cyclase (GGDEF)-like protein